MLPTRHTRNNNKTELVQQLLDAHIIGLCIDDDFTYDEENRTRRLSHGETEKILALVESSKYPEAESKVIFPAKKIKNYVVYNPYESAAMVFLHGKDIFSPEAAHKFYDEHDRSESLFNPEAIAKIERALLPESFDGRLGGFMSASGISDEMRFEICSRGMQVCYPELDFSALPNMLDVGYYAYVDAFISLLEENGIDMSKVLENSLSGDPHEIKFIKEEVEKLESEKLNIYLATPESSEQLDGIKERLANLLKSYLESHEWDWEILTNFKAGLSIAAANEQDTVEDILQKGARVRAVKTLEKLAEKMGNPYDECFEKTEQSMAKIVADST